ncbi:hypothetical protein [Spiroplasma taiwanense]|uniref:Uncharacterized protein n=1 Tax=Spiroplasma taiwanense CT-1 TaxID=1276220 RepID=S5LXJ6_9MOLU|nr:hypothetical protein [Spiroplasma taiwanense]AGR41336.1 hypothetical protein STAIW_v1c07240 [Spiroplasma taiwanense CT-1]
MEYAATGVFLKNELGLQKDGKDIEIEASDLFTNETGTSDNKELYNSIAQATDASALRKILQKDSNIAILAKDFKSLSTKNSQNETNTYAKAFALGIDSMGNKVYANYANNLGKQRIVTSSENKDFIYNYYNDSFKINNSSGIKSITEVIQWLEQLIKIENLTGSLNSDVSKLDETGTLFVANSDTGSKVYSSSYFAQGTMLMASGSSAGSFYYSTTPSKIVENEADYKAGKVMADVAVATTDLFAVASSTAKGDSYVMQQGPGIALFKSSSNEKASVEKNLHIF